MSGSSIRIIGGVWRSRRIRLPVNSTIKPTPDRVRETVFNWLSTDIAGSYCLDLFAGSGSLGLEALSRGAAWVGFVEQSYSAAHTLGQHIRQFNATDRASVYHQPYKQLHAAQLAMHQVPITAITIIFLDPPFRKNMLAASLDWILTQSFISPTACLYLEHEPECTLPSALTSDWKPYKQQRAGQVCYSLWREK